MRLARSVVLTIVPSSIYYTGLDTKLIPLSISFISPVQEVILRVVKQVLSSLS